MTPEEQAARVEDQKFLQALAAAQARVRELEASPCDCEDCVWARAQEKKEKKA